MSSAPLQSAPLPPVRPSLSNRRHRPREYYILLHGAEDKPFLQHLLLHTLASELDRHQSLAAWLASSP